MSEAREDLLLVPHGGGYPLADGAVRDLVRALFTTRAVVPLEEVQPAGLVRLYLGCGPTGHAWFARGAAPEVPYYEELVIAFGEVPAPLPDGSGDAWFWVEFRGARARPLGKARAEIARRLGADLTLRARPHTGIPPRPEGAPAQADAPADEPEPVGRCGVRVEEF